MKRTPSGQQDSQASLPPSSSRNEKVRPSPPPARPSLQQGRPQISRRQNVPSRMSETMLASPSPTGQSPTLPTQPAPPSSDLAEQEDTTPTAQPSASTTSPSALDLESLREAVNKIQRKPFKGHSNPASPASPRTNMRKQVLSGTQAEPTSSHRQLSPSLEASFTSPLATGAQTSHSESTESTESAGTVRASAAPTPSAYPMRTPSYPFPYVPSGHYNYNPPMHQPFTVLSPTISDHTQRLAADHQSASTRSTPLGPPSFFGPMTNMTMPPGDSNQAPDLYDVVLRLNAEPTLAAWWSTLTTVLREQYRIDRASIAIPADTSDLENVPWGQKASYNAAGLSDISLPPHSVDNETNPSTDSGSTRRSDTDSPQNLLRANAVRPQLEARHSFAGYEFGRGAYEHVESRGAAPIPAGRPSVARRTTSHVSVSQTALWADQFPESPAIHSESHGSARPLADRSEDELDESMAMVLPMLRALNRERDPLLDSGGVNRIVQRSRMVILTRDYATTPSTQTSSRETDKAVPVAQEEHNTASVASSYDSQASHKEKSSINARTFHGANYSSTTGRLHRSSSYEEYEQFPSSPWAQSPAPSPAVQHDSEHNPFFSQGALDEETFSPTPMKEDYTSTNQVEAIGIDRASTIIHIPLIHPLLSRIIHKTEREEHIEANQARKRRRSKQAATSALERKAPIAILSVLSSDVPYSQVFLQSIKHLAPHLATSFQNSLQNTTLRERVAGAIYRQRQHGRAAPGSLALSGNRLGLGLGLESLLQFDDDGISSTVGSMASPSEYSSKSRSSPPGSNLGTPNIDSAATFASTRQAGSATTPGISHGTDVTDNYFDLKKRIPLNRAKSGLPTAQVAPTSQSSARLGSEHRSALRKLETSPPRERSTDAKKEHKRHRLRGDKESSPADSSPSSKRNSQPPSATDDAKHTYLHSHGADFNASFQSLPSATLPRGSGVGAHSRRTSGPEVYDMPPPSERLLRTIIDSLPVQIFTSAPLTGRVTWVNSKFLVYRGQTAPEVLDAPWSTIHPEDLQGYMAEWNRSLHTGNQFQHKIRLRRFDDCYRWYYVRAAPLRDKMQNIVHWVGTMIDLHDQHVAEVNASKQQETAASEAKYRALANSSPQIVFAATRLKGLTFCNSQWLSYAGQTEEQARGTGFLEHVFPEDLIKCKLPDFDERGENTSNVPITVATPKRTTSESSSADEGTVRESGTPSGVLSPGGVQPSQRKLSELAITGLLSIKKDANGRPSYSTEVRLRMKSGEYRWHLVRVLLAQPLVSSDAEEDTWYGTCTDINDHKELEQTLKETMDAKSRFLSNMSHEIRTPLNGIAGMASFLIDSNLTAEQLDQVNVIRASTEGLRDLINDILDLSKVEAGMITLEMNWLHIRSVIEEVNDLTSSLALDKGIELNYYVEESVPSRIKGDKFRFRQVLLNVIGNAIKFTQKGEVFIRCSLEENDPTPQKDSVMLRFEVIDTGAGFSKKEAQKLFKRFSQIDGSTTRQHGGTGLGLVISMQLVQLHGGIMTADSEPGEGSTFTFTMRFDLPTAEAKPAMMPKDNNTEDGKVMAQDPSKKMGWPSQVTVAPERAHAHSKQVDISMSPDFYAGLGRATEESPMVSSAGSSASSAMASLASMASSRSSLNTTTAGDPIELSLPSDERDKRHHEKDEDKTLRELGDKKTQAAPGVAVKARLFSILVVCPLKWTCTAVVGHIRGVLNHHVPHTVTHKQSLEEALKMLRGPESFVFSHLVVIFNDMESILTLVNAVLKLPNPTTSVVIASDTTLRKELIASNTQLNFDQLQKDQRVQFIQKPIKPSRLAPVFDPEKSRELSTDQNLHSAQQIALSQKKVFDEMARRLGNKDIKVLLVEDNRINQMVMLKLLKRVQVAVETCFDGVQATDKVLAKPAGYFSIILLDLMMPNKDGYQTCIDIRAWEKENSHPPIPIVALSANVLDDVWQKCKEAGFNSYLTKPVEFKELSDVMTQHLDPDEAEKEKGMQWMDQRPETKRNRSDV